MWRESPFYVRERRDVCCRGEGVHAVITHLPEVTEEAVERGSRWVSDIWERKTERNLEEPGWKEMLKAEWGSHSGFPRRHQSQKQPSSNCRHLV